MKPFLLDLDTIKASWQAFFASPKGKWLSKAVNYLLVGGILGLLLYNIYKIGPLRVLRNLPHTPWYYLLFLVLHFALPVTEVFIYKLSWKFPFWKGLKAFIQKKILNADVIGYSGEAYLYMWGRKNLEEDNRSILSAIKDNNIISSWISTIMAIVLLAFFMFLSEIPFLQVLQISETTLSLVVGFALLLVLLALIFRRRILAMSLRVTLGVLGLYTARILLMNVVEALQWSLVIPEVPLHVWFTFLAIKIIVGRIPFMPSQDLVFANFCILLAEPMGVPQAAIAGMALTTVLLSKAANFILYMLFPITNNSEGETEPGRG